VHAYPVLLSAESIEAAIKKETPVAKERFPEDEYGKPLISLVGPEE